MLALALALGSSACYGLSNFIGPQLARRHTIVTILLVSQLAALIGCALYLAGDRGPALPAGSMLLAVLAGLGNGAGLIGFYKAAELGPLSIVAPIGATGAIVPVAYGLATGDTLKATQVAGVVLAMAGAALAARAEPAGAQRASRYPDPRASVIWALGSAVAFGVFLTALPKASEDGRALGAVRRPARAARADGALGGAPHRQPARLARPPADGDPRRCFSYAARCSTRWPRTTASSRSCRWSGRCSRS